MGKPRKTDRGLVLVKIPVILSSAGSNFGKNNQSQCDCDCDCACSHATDANEPTPSSIGTKYRISPGYHRTPFDADYFIVSMQRKAGMLLINDSAWSIANFFETANDIQKIPPAWAKDWGTDIVHASLEKMVQVGLLVPDGVEDRTDTAKDGETLSVWLHITDQCNLRCDYCYLPHHGSDMSLETGKRSLDVVFDSAIKQGYRQVKIKYSGGEPLLRFPAVLELHEYARSLAEKHGVTLDGVVLSNGTLLTPEGIAKIQHAGLRLMISLDGLGNAHDLQRHYQDGAGSAQKVMAAIELALAYGLIPSISITVSGRTAGHLAETIAWVLARNLPFSINFYRENNLSEHWVDLRLDDEKIINGLKSAFKVIEANLPRRSLLAGLLDRANLAVPHQRTCATGRNYLVFDPQGHIATCQMDIAAAIDPANLDNPLASVRALQSGIQNLPVDEKETCRVCEWKYWCAGGCPLATYRSTGRYDVQSPNCNIYRTLFPDVLRLEGLRLLKYAGSKS